MNDHNLDDLIVDTPKQSKAKGFLTIIALFIVVLIVAIILTKIILKDSKTGKPALIDENTEMISPELTLQHAIEEPKESEDPALSDMIKDDEIDAPVENVSQKPNSDQTKEAHAQEETIVIDEEKGEVTIATPKQPTVQKEKKTAVTTKPAMHKIATSKPKKIQHTTLAYYIQVGSFRKTPIKSSRLISAIKKNGYHYNIYSSNGMKKVLIGPYKSRAEADRAIIRVKDRINKHAFVFTK
ncbi:Arginine/ornithine antiporter ArcD [hydrothermal vent metagenome]|uniref:Arginine/ornithine antiporter ArcD n=1 Tax=hydrothermal vent metagenome TaxID=652676 RepID=A0A1W1E8D2_9ZZZZ